MRRYITAIANTVRLVRLVVICLILLAAGAICAPAVQVKVMTYNIHQEVGASAGYSSANAQKIARIINYYQPDVLAINELEGSSTATATSNLKFWCSNYLTYLGGLPDVTYFCYVSPTSDGYNRNAIISRYPIADRASYSLSPRDLLCGTILLPEGQDVRIFTAHFKAGNSASDANTRQSNADNTMLRINQWSGDPANAGIPYLMCGDLNEDESNPQYPLSSTYHPIATVMQAYLNSFTPTSGWGNCRTISSTSPTRRFDYVLPSWHLQARSQNAVDVQDNSIVCDTNIWFNHNQLPPGLSRFDSQGSDHLAVLGTFDLQSNVLSDMKGQTNGSLVQATSKAVTASYPDHFYIEDTNRISAIRVNSTANPVAGSLVHVKGTLAVSDSAEDAIAATELRVISTTAGSVMPVAVSARDINGEPLNGAWVPGRRGPSNAALLVKTWGNVMSAAPGAFRIDDGSGLPVRVASDRAVDVGDFVTVVGVVGFYVPSDTISPRRLIKTRSASDVTVLQTAPAR